MAATLILFDVDGTLVDTAGAGRRALGRAFRSVFGVDSFDARTQSVAFAGLTDLKIIAALAEAVGVPGPRLDASRQALYQAYFDALREEMARQDPRRRVLPGVLPLLKELDLRADVFLGLLTGNLERGARAKLEPFGLNRYFPDGGFGSDHAVRREVARLAREKLSRRSGIRFSPSQVTVIGDTHHDVECARANGYRAIAVDSGWAPRERLESSEPDALLNTLQDLPAVLKALGLHRIHS